MLEIRYKTETFIGFVKFRFMNLWIIGQYLSSRTD